MRTLSPGHGVCEMIWNAPAPEAAFPPTEVAAARSVSGVTSMGRVQPEAVDCAGAWATAGAEVGAGGALAELDGLPAHAVATRASSRPIGAKRRTIVRALPTAMAIVPRASLQRDLIAWRSNATDGPSG